MRGSQLKSNLTASGTIIAILGVLVAVTIMSWIARIHLPTSADYGPLQMSLYTVRLAAGLPFYRDFRQPPWLPVIYGPIAPWLASHLAHAFGTGVQAAMAAGRLISIVAALAVALMIFALAKLHKASTAAAIIVALAFILSPLTRFQGAEYRVDLLALAFNLGGVLFI